MTEDKQIKPLVSDLPPVMWKAEHMTYDMCSAECGKLQKQLVVIHNLPKVNGDSPLVYMHETLEQIRRRFRELQQRQIELHVEARKKEKNERRNQSSLQQLAFKLK